MAISLLPPLALAASDLLRLQDVPVLGFCTNGIIWYVALCNWLLSLDLILASGVLLLSCLQAHMFSTLKGMNLPGQWLSIDL